MFTGLFIDVSNLYYCVKKKFAGRKINYEMLYGHFNRGAHIAAPSDQKYLSFARAYGIRHGSEAKAFIRTLQSYGFETSIIKSLPKRHTSLNVDITIDVIRRASKLQTVILGTSDRDILPLIKWLHEQGIKVIEVGCGVPVELQHSPAEIVEITEDFLENTNEPTTSSNTE